MVRSLSLRFDIPTSRIQPFLSSAVSRASVESRIPLNIQPFFLCSWISSHFDIRTDFTLSNLVLRSLLGPKVNLLMGCSPSAPAPSVSHWAPASPWRSVQPRHFPLRTPARSTIALRLQESRSVAHSGASQLTRGIPPVAWGDLLREANLN